ncbi:MAG: vWA domain-containing protein [Thermoguttaceae bacterium]
MKHSDGENVFYESKAEGGSSEGGNEEGTDGSLSASDLLADAASDSSVQDPSQLLPKATGAIGPGTVDGGGPLQPGAAQGGRPGAGGFGGKAAVNVFGTQGVGNKFAYVFDRSTSMEGSGRSPLEAAKSELIASLDSLGDTHQFQIVFYNEKPQAFNPSGQPGKLAFATPQNKERARRFIGSITASGQTAHEGALKLAIRMQPDVIFFLTDADDPQLNGRQLYEIQRQAAGIQINAIEFGIGPKQSGDNFLVKLARQNGGQYSYRDITKFGVRPAPGGRAADPSELPLGPQSSAPAGRGSL